MKNKLKYCFFTNKSIDEALVLLPQRPYIKLTKNLIYIFQFDVKDIISTSVWLTTRYE